MGSRSELVKRVEAASSRPADLGGAPPTSISLAMGEPAGPTPRPVVTAAIASLTSGRTGYERVSGSPTLRERIARALNDGGATEIGADNVVVTHGASGGLAASILALVDPGDVVVLPEPTYSLYADQVAMVGGRVRWVRNDQDGAPRLDELGVALTDAKLLVVCNPSNPTGYVLEEYELKAIVEMAAGRGARVLLDEAYRDIVYDGVAFASSTPMVPQYPHVLCCGTFSKSFAMTGWRLGWVLADAQTADAINLVHRTVNGPLNTFVQDAASAALDLPDAYLHGVVSELQARRDVVCESLAAIPGVDVAVPRGAFYAFPRIRHVSSSTELAASLKGSGVLVRAGREYGPSGEGHIRISFASDMPRLRAGMARVAESLAQI